MSCNNNKNSSAIQAKESEDLNFFPVTSFLKGQMAELDSMQVTSLHTITVNAKIDSVWLKKEEIKPLLQDFFFQEINPTNLTRFFKVTKFNDQSINAITFTYDPIKVLPDSITFRHWDIYINPETGKITKVYIVKLQNENGNSYTKQLTWQTDKWAKIITFLNKPDGNMELIKEGKVIWDLE
jgi:hypothetical protein